MAFLTAVTQRVNCSHVASFGAGVAATAFGSKAYGAVLQRLKTDQPRAASPIQNPSASSDVPALASLFGKAETAAARARSNTFYFAQA